MAHSKSTTKPAPRPRLPAQDLICPACHRPGLGFSSLKQHVWCLALDCGWRAELTAEAAQEIALALVGITDVPVAQYLQVLYAAGASLPPPTPIRPAVVAAVLGVLNAPPATPARRAPAGPIYLTHPAPSVTKKTCPAPAGETDAARCKRLGRQAAANRIRAYRQPDGSWQVDSQRRSLPDNRPAARYRVEALPGGGLACTCEWAVRHPHVACSHISQVQKQLDRSGRAAARAQQDDLSDILRDFHRYERALAVVPAGKAA